MYNSITAGMVFINMTLKDAELRDGLKKSQQKIESFASHAKRALAEINLAASGSGAAFLAVSGQVYSAMRVFTRFDDKIRTLKAISGGTASAIAGLEKYIRQQGATTAFTADQIADGTVELSRMGFEVDELQEALRPVMDLVRATGEETFKLGEVSDYAASVLRIFNLRADKFGDVCDVMAFAANKSSAGIADMGEAFKIAGPSAAAVNEDVRDTAAALMLMANAGIKGSLAGTSLRKIYQSIAAESGKTEGLSAEEIQAGYRGSEALQSLGIRVVDDKGNLRKAADVMVDLARAVRDMKTGEKINFATEVFDLRGSLGALTMLADSSGQMKKFHSEMQNIAGYAHNLAEEMESGPGGVLRRLFAGLSEAARSFGMIAFQAFSPLLVQLTNLATALVKLMDGGNFAVSTLTKMSVYLLGAGAGIKALAIALSGFKAMFAPLFKITGFFDHFISGAHAAEKAHLKWLDTVKKNQIVQEADIKFSQASGDLDKTQKHRDEVKAAQDSALAVEAAEKKKLDAARRRLTVLEDLEKKQRARHEAASARRMSDEDFRGLERELAAQEKAVESSAKKTEQLRARYSEVQTSVDEARAVELAEQQKLEAVRKRFAAQEALNEKWRLQHTLSGSTKKFQETPEFTSVKKELEAQEKVVAQATARRAGIEKRRHLDELQRTSEEAKATLAAEQQKLAAVKARYDAEVALRQRHADAGLMGKYTPSPTVAAASAELSAQEKAVAQAEKAVKKYSEELSAAETKVSAASDALKKADTALKFANQSVVIGGTQYEFFNKAIQRTVLRIKGESKALQGNIAVRLRSILTSKMHLTVLSRASVAMLQQAGASKALAFSLKGLAAAQLTVNAAMKMMAQNPLGTATAIIGTLTSIANYLHNEFYNKRFEIRLDVVTSEIGAQQSLGERLEEQHKEEDLRLKRLQQLSQKNGPLTSEEMEEAQSHLNILKSRGVELAAVFDKAGKSFSLIGDTSGSLRDKQVGEIQKNTQSLLRAREKVKKELEKQGGFEGRVGANILNNGVDNAVKKREALVKQLNIIEQEIAKNNRRIAARGSKPVTGIAERIEREAARVKASAEEIKKATEEIIKIEDANAAFVSSDWENEIHKIREVRKEYEKYMEVLLLAEKAKRNPNTSYIADLESRLAQARKDFAEQEREAKNKAAIAERATTHYFVDKYNEDKKKQAETVVSDKFSDLLSGKKYGEAQKYMAGLMSEALARWREAVNNFNKSYGQARSAGSERGTAVSAMEQKTLDDLKKAGDEAFAQFVSYRDRLREARKAGDDALKSVDRTGMGDWSVRNLSSMLGASSWQERTAKATEDTAKNTKRMLRLKDGTIISYS